MQSQLYKKRVSRAKKWAKGFCEKKLEYNFYEQRFEIEEFLSKSIETLEKKILLVFLFLVTFFLLGMLQIF